MIHGVDTGFLVAAEVVEHPCHVDARSILGNLVATGDSLAITPQVLAEFIHIVTDARRFSQPCRSRPASSSAGIRVPLMIGCPSRMAGSTTIRSSQLPAVPSDSIWMFTR